MWAYTRHFTGIRVKSNGVRVNGDLGAPRGIPLPDFDDTQYDQAKVRRFHSLSARGTEGRDRDKERRRKR